MIEQTGDVILGMDALLQHRPDLDDNIVVATKTRQGVRSELYPIGWTIISGTVGSSNDDIGCNQRSAAVMLYRAGQCNVVQGCHPGVVFCRVMASDDPWIFLAMLLLKCCCNNW